MSLARALGNLAAGNDFINFGAAICASRNNVMSESDNEIQSHKDSILESKLTRILAGMDAFKLEEVAFIPPAERPDNDAAFENDGDAPFVLAVENGRLHLGIPIWTSLHLMPPMIKKLIAITRRVRDWEAQEDGPVHAPEELARVVSKNCPDQAKLLLKIEEVTFPLLVLTPDHHIALNLRKLAVLCTGDGEQRVGKAYRELEVTRALLCKKPASSSLWHHRFWLISELLRFDQTAVDMEALIQREASVIEMAAIRKSRNYYAWAYRTRLFRFLAKHHITANERALELAYVEKWTAVGRDLTALHYLAWLKEFQSACEFPKVS